MSAHSQSPAMHLVRSHELVSVQVTQVVSKVIFSHNGKESLL